MLVADEVLYKTGSSDECVQYRGHYSNRFGRSV